MTDSLSIGGAPVTVGGETIDLTPAVHVAAQSAYAVLVQPGLRVSSQTAAVALLQAVVQVAAQSAALAMFPVPAPPPPRRRQYVLM